MPGSTALFRAKAPPIMKQLMADFEFSVEDAAAVLGNIGGETGGFVHMQELKPTVAGSLGGWGWCQWTGPRRRAFDAYCERNNLDKSSDKANYGWLFTELKTTEKGAVPAVKRAKGLVGKTKAFEMAFERAGVKHYANRIFWAQQAMSAYEAKYGTNAVPPPPDIEPPMPKAPPSFWGSVFRAIIEAIFKRKS
jgi:hypothetical protein